MSDLNRRHALMGLAAAAAPAVLPGFAHAFPQDDSGPGVHEFAFDVHLGRAVDDLIFRAVLHQSGVEHGVGTDDFTHLIQGHLVHLAGGGHSVLLEKMVHDGYGKDVVAHFRQREGHRGQVPIGGRNRGAFVQRR